MVQNLSATGLPVSAVEGALFSGRCRHLCWQSTALWLRRISPPRSTGATDRYPRERSRGTASNGFAVSGDHIYTTAGTYPVTVTITIPSTGDSATTHVTAQVLASLQAIGSTVTASEGQPFSGRVATFVSANVGSTAGDFTASIDWGDGSATTPGTVDANAQGGFDVFGSHTYAEAGAYRINVTITDTITGKSASTPGRLATGGRDEHGPISVRRRDGVRRSHLCIRWLR